MCAHTCVRPRARAQERCAQHERSRACEQHASARLSEEPPQLPHPRDTPLVRGARGVASTGVRQQLPRATTILACVPPGRSAAPRQPARTLARTKDCPSIARVRDVARPRLHDAFQRQTWDSRQHNATAASMPCVHTSTNTHPEKKTQQHTARRGTRARRSSRVQNVTTSSGGHEADMSSRLRWWLRALRARDRAGAVSRRPATSAEASARAHTAGARLPK